MKFRGFSVEQIESLYHSVHDLMIPMVVHKPALPDSLKLKLLGTMLDDITFVAMPERWEVQGNTLRKSKTIRLNVKLFEPGGAPRERLYPVLLHEFVHLAGGRELDCEVLEWYYFEKMSATAPTKKDLRIMTRDLVSNKGKMGNFTKLQLLTGRAYSLNTYRGLKAHLLLFQEDKFKLGAMRGR